jgi:hypothetical protein
LQGSVIKGLQFADDTDFLVEEESQLQIQLTNVCQAGEDLTAHKHGQVQSYVDG